MHLDFIKSNKHVQPPNAEIIFTAFFLQVSKFFKPTTQYYTNFKDVIDMHMLI